MAMLPEGLHDEIDVYHAWKFTAVEALWSVSGVGDGFRIGEESRGGRIGEYRGEYRGSFHKRWGCGVS
jgi:hypothetical protein